MFTLDAVRRTPSVDSATAGSHDARRGHDEIAEIRRRLLRDLNEADTAIRTGRIEDAHETLIRAQDMAFEHYLALGASDPKRRGQRSTDLFLLLTDRLIDANRFKDRAIIAECRRLLDPLAEAHVTGRTAPVTTLT